MSQPPLPPDLPSSLDAVHLDIRDAFSRRESLVVENADAVETGAQRASIALRVLAVLEVRWRVTRHGRYTWRRDAEAGWVLRHVVLDREEIRRDGIGLAGRASYGRAAERGAS